MNPAPKDSDAHAGHPAPSSPAAPRPRWRRELARAAWWATVAARWAGLKVATGLRDIGLSWFTGSPEAATSRLEHTPHLLEEPPSRHPERMPRGGELTRDELLWRQEMKSRR